MRNADWRTTPPTSMKVGDVVRPWFGVLGGSQTVSPSAYEQRLAIGGTAPIMQHLSNPKVFAASQYQEDP